MRSNNLLLAALLLSAVAGARAQDCPALTAASRQRAAGYVTARYGLATGASLSLQADALLPGSCMRRLTFLVDWPRRTITLLVSPDGRYAFPAFFDLTQPPPRGNAAALLNPPAGPPLGASASAPAPALDAAAFRELASAPGAALGPSSAPVTVVEFSDFECPFCARLATTLRTQVLPAHTASPKDDIRFVFLPFPLPIHPWAEAAAEMSVCAAAQNPDAFWRLHDFLFSHQAQLRPETLDSAVDGFLAGQRQIDPARFHACMAARGGRAEVLADLALGRKNGVRGTPTLFVNGTRMVGARTAPELEQAIAAARAKGTP